MQDQALQDQGHKEVNIDAKHVPEVFDVMNNIYNKLKLYGQKT